MGLAEAAAIRQFLAFLIATVAWATIAAAVLAAEIAHPLAVGAVWIVGFVWITGYIAAGRNAADLLTKRWLQMLAGISVVAGLIVLAFS